MEHEFDDRIRSWISETLASGSALSFSDLVVALPGVHPNDVAECIDQLELEVPRKPKQSHLVSRRARLGFPVPHPLDYDWRFTDLSRSVVLRKVTQAVSAGGKVVFLGAPTLFHAAQDTQRCRSSLHRSASYWRITCQCRSRSSRGW
jgi:hypothetical protein